MMATLTKGQLAQLCRRLLNPDCYWEKVCDKLLKANVFVLIETVKEGVLYHFKPEQKQFFMMISKRRPCLLLSMSQAPKRLVVTMIAKGKPSV